MWYSENQRFIENRSSNHHSLIWATSSSGVVNVAILNNMFRAFGMILLIWFLSGLFSETFEAANGAFTATFEAVEATVKHSETILKK